MNQPMDITLKVGESKKIVKGFMKTLALVYAGEVSDNVYSLVPVWSSGNNSAAHNLYFPKSQRDIPIFGGSLIVLELTSRQIRFQFDKNKLYGSG